MTHETPERIISANFLKRDIPNSRIFTWGYYLRALKANQAANQASIFTHAENLLGDISRSRKTEEENRPIIFVGHSLGGLVIKEALIRSSEYYHNGQDEDHGAIFVWTKGTVFIGNPHRGTSQASIGHMAAKIAEAVGFRQNDRLVTLLEQESDILEYQRRSFASISRELPIACVFEENPTSLGVTKRVIVPEHSASIDGFNVKISSIPADYIQMCKFDTDKHIGYRRISGHIIDFVKRTDRERLRGQYGSITSTQTPNIPVRLLSAGGTSSVNTATRASKGICTFAEVEELV